MEKVNGAKMHSSAGTWQTRGRERFPSAPEAWRRERDNEHSSKTWETLWEAGLTLPSLESELDLETYF